LQLHPSFFGKQVHKHIEDELRAKFAGKCTGRFGYTIAIPTVLDYGAGVLDIESGFAKFEVEYLALVFRPFRFEVLPAIVKQVSQNGFFAAAGPCVDIFVSTTLMPSNFVYTTSLDAMPSFVAKSDDTNEPDIKITTNSAVRIKILAVRHTADKLIVVGLINEDYLGDYVED
jgi:DNA-directed RNA polymerase II subunit RPB7